MFLRSQFEKHWPIEWNPNSLWRHIVICPTSYTHSQAHAGHVQTFWTICTSLNLPACFTLSSLCLVLSHTLNARCPMSTEEHTLTFKTDQASSLLGNFIHPFPCCALSLSKNKALFSLSALYIPCKLPYLISTFYYTYVYVCRSLPVCEPQKSHGPMLLVFVAKGLSQCLTFIGWFKTVSYSNNKKYYSPEIKPTTTTHLDIL